MGKRRGGERELPTNLQKGEPKKLIGSRTQRAKGRGGADGAKRKLTPLRKNPEDEW